MVTIATVLVTGDVVDAVGQPAPNVLLTFSLASPEGNMGSPVWSETNTGCLVSPEDIPITTDDAGHFEVSLIPNGNLTPTSVYKVLFSTGEYEQVTVPVEGPTQLYLLLH